MSFLVPLWNKKKIHCQNWQISLTYHLLNFPLEIWWQRGKHGLNGNLTLHASLRLPIKNNQGSFMCGVKYTILLWEFNQLCLCVLLKI